MAHRYRIYPTLKQEAIFARHCADVRFIWNLTLEQLNHYDKRIAQRRSPGPAERGRQLTELRQTTWLGQGSSPIQQQALRDFERALKNWWGKSHRRPTWRKAGRHEGFCVRDVKVNQINRKSATVNVPKCGYVRFRLTRTLPDTFGMARVTLDRSGRWHVAFSAPQPAIQRTTTNNQTGIDLGIAATLTQSDGSCASAPGLKVSERKRKLCLERKLARQLKGSNRRAVTKLKLAKLAARQADRLNDWREKVTTALVIDNDLIAVENLKVSNMMASAKGTLAQPGKNVSAKRGLNRQIARQGWSAFALRLEQKAQAAGVELVRVAPRNTSRRCNTCDHTAAENRKSQAVFECQACGHQDHADVNAAKNILAAGLAVAGRGGSVRPLVAVAASGGPGEASTTEVVLCAA